jgi:hypothetical protein
MSFHGPVLRGDGVSTWLDTRQHKTFPVIRKPAKSKDMLSLSSSQQMLEFCIGLPLDIIKEV